MKYTLLVSIAARDEATVSYHYYEGLRAGLGDEFLDELERHYQKLATNPLAYSFINNSKNLRDVYLDRFPFVIIFIVISQQVNVVSIRHTSRKPYI